MSEFHLDVDAYLARIGAQRPEERTPESLSVLVRAHLTHVPFEDLEQTEAHTQPSLEPERLFEKVVQNRRGGFCFELNKLFYMLLTELGFRCLSVGVRVLNGRPEPRPYSHRGTVVYFGEEKWYCDVGYGGNGPKDILRLDDPGIQTLRYERFRVIQEDGQYVIVYLDGKDGPVRMLKFREQEFLDVDFDVLKTYSFHNPLSSFRTKRVVYLCTEEGWIGLRENLFTVFHRGSYETRVLTEEAEIRQLVEREFHMIIPQWQKH